MLKLTKRHITLKNKIKIRRKSKADKLHRFFIKFDI